MSKIKWLWSIRLGAIALLLSFSAASAESPLQINSDAACMKCHKRNGSMLGHHGQDTMKMSCSSCHGEKGDHPKKPNDLVVFSLQEGSELDKQLAVCRKCHTPKKLSAADWTHNVHAKKVPCAACHKLHSATDPMAEMTPKVRSELCSSCHAGKQE
ncbi:nitrite reductase [Shewanella glacialipiscicola]|uniref:Cytochrome C nitrite reductase pentaheme subunit n=1 Tax=Shewanella glacialipiscicola TaxID=614069 RepID=A0ABQ6J7P4_9GAMM|nr:nitrite reductase [Shewanella glacialipiscicola]MCL1085478.1 nitrite reductase [Shewanella glacialipiscicola]MCU7994307.1 nitrite reductase [Shewanella glacialipiscicola]MCU8025778.1 nitrite reductase [Shewanella glacialipiscicola]GIU14750.1 cytochrome C nitrite reductase pentaheme subunit [Shewanella glacialipiscicola]GMA83767.1 cytochrome C nitrite reductase pentaheme subunit [Shewanella glacialipiscicola]